MIVTGKNGQSAPGPQASAPPTSEASLRTALRSAVRSTAGADAAGLLIAEGGRATTPVATHESARHADELQYTLDEGPCLTAMWGQAQVQVPDISAETRWPSWVEAMSRESGLRSMVVLRPPTADHQPWALSLYSTKPNGFQRDEHAVQALAAHIAIAIGTALEVEGLRAALTGRTVVGQAQGLVMERYGVDAAEALALLARSASQSNRRLRDVAREIVDTRRLPRG